MAISAGARLGPYEILAAIGAGGMGEVYRAKDPRLGRDVAIKVLPASLSSDPDRLKRFAQEARAAGVLNHPNITMFVMGDGSVRPIQDNITIYNFSSMTTPSGGEVIQEKN